MFWPESQANGGSSVIGKTSRLRRKKEIRDRSNSEVTDGKVAVGEDKARAAHARIPRAGGVKAREVREFFEFSFNIFLKLFYELW